MSHLTDADLYRMRGDTFAFAFQIRDDGVVRDITDHTFRLAVDPSEEPANSDNQLFLLTGTITNAVQGLVMFGPLTTQQANYVGEYFYDLEMIDDTGQIRTVKKGKFVFEQDRTK